MFAYALERADILGANRSRWNDDIGLRDSPIFAVVVCRWLLSILNMKSRCGFATLSTSVISLRGLAYSARGRAERFQRFTSFGKPQIHESNGIV